MILLAASPLRADPPELPGPALDVPVEVDGDGVSTYGDVWVFNHWLSLGGSLDKALSHALEPGDAKTIDLSEFFASSAAALSKESPLYTGEVTKLESTSTMAEGGAAGGMSAPMHIDSTRRIPASEEPDGASEGCRITPDGQYFVFCSRADLGFGSNDFKQVYRVRIEPDEDETITLVSDEGSETLVEADCLHPSISDDGQVVVFDTTADLTSEDQNEHSDVYVRDFTGMSAVTRLLSLAVGGTTAGNGASEYAAVSGDGEVVEFASVATNLTTGDVEGFGDVFRVGTGIASPSVDMELVSVSDCDEVADGILHTTSPNLGSVGQVINETGDLIVFQGIVDSGWNCTDSSNSISQVYVRDTTNDRTWEVSAVSSNGDLGDLGSRRASISADGSRIAFSSKAENLDPDEDTTEDVYHVAFEQGTGQNDGPQFPLEKIRGWTDDATPQVDAPDGTSTLAMLDETGTHIVFASAATNLTDPDVDPSTNAVIHIYLHHLESGLDDLDRTQRMSADCAGTHGDATSFDPDVGLAGRAVVYQSLADNLLDANQDASGAPGDDNQVQDVFESRLRAAFIRGDVEQNGVLNVTDANNINNWLFLGGSKPPCLDAADVNDDATVDVTDATYLLNYLNLGGSEPEDPFDDEFENCDFDPTDDCITCKTLPDSYCAEGHPHGS